MKFAICYSCEWGFKGYKPIQNVLSEGGPSLTTFFFSWWEEGGSKYHMNDIPWRADDDPTLNAGLVFLWFSAYKG